MKNDINISLVPYESNMSDPDWDLDRIIYDLDAQIDLLSSQADNLDYLIAVASGILCGMLDILWVGEFSLEYGREIGSDKVEAFVKKVAKLTGCESDDLGASVKHLEKMFPIPSDGNTPDFGGGLQHHLKGAASSAIVYTKVEMAKANDLNTYKYLTYLLSQRPDAKMSDEQLEQLAPWSETAKANCQN